MSLTKKLMVIGKVVRKLAPKISLIEVQTNQLDTHLSMYFARYDEYKADDGPHSLKFNDIVLMKSKENPERVDLIYEVADVVIRDGQIRDPLTGQRVLGDLTSIDFEKDMARINNLLPDRGQSQATLHYSPDFMAAGLPQSPRDKS